MKRRIRWLVPGAVAAAALASVPVVTAAPAGKTIVCHATGSSSNPFVTITPNINGAYHGHLGHHDDVIPPFEFGGRTYSLNWPSDEVAIRDGRCVAERHPTNEPPEGVEIRRPPRVVGGTPRFTG